MKKIIITGSSRGIGRAITEYLLEHNWQVVGLARDHDINPLSHTNYCPISVDLADKLSSLEQIFKQIQIQHPVIDAMLINAGYGRFAELEQFSTKQIERLMQVNFTSQALLVKQFLPQMKQQRAGHIIFMGSDAALQGQKKGAIYCASKFALRGFSQSLRQECASAKIKVTLINPGMVASSFYQELSFKPGDAIENYIDIQQLINTVAFILKQPQAVIDEINLSPLKKVIVKQC